MPSELENAMLKHMKKIVYEENRPFSFLDFMKFNVDKQYSAKRGTIRNKFSKFVKENKIEFCYNDGVAFYTLVGKQFGKNKLMTPNHTDTSNTIINYNTDKRTLLKSIKKHPIYKLILYIPFGKRSIHDLHLTFESKGLWRYLSNIEYFKQRTDSQSKSICFGYFQIEKYLAINVKVQNTDTVTVTVRCSTNPIILDPDGIMRFTEALTRVEERLAAILNNIENKTHNVEYNPSEITIPNRDEWTIVLWHFNRDSLTEYSSEKFHCSWRIAKNLFIRVYSKELKLKTIVRVELQENPDITFKQLITQFIRDDTKTRLIELLN